jgi:hypothetical protein
MPLAVSVQQQFEDALASVRAKCEQDPYVLALIVCGSLAHDRVWHKSDMDLIIVMKDDKTGWQKRQKTRTVALTENDVNIHVILFPRAEFKRLIDGSTQSSFFHSFFAKSRLDYARDPTIEEMYQNINRLGSRDRQVQLLRAASMAIPSLYKAEKWFYVRKDYEYSYHFILYCLTALAAIEVNLAGQITGREVIQQALELNPGFFEPLYRELMNRKKTAKDVAAALEQIDQYLTRKKRALFQPVLDYLSEQGSVRTASEIETHFKNNMNVEGVTTVCEWLADKDVISKVSAPVRLAERSKVEFDEMAFYYDGDGDGK